jgi:hypothetical protein
MGAPLFFKQRVSGCLSLSIGDNPSYGGSGPLPKIANNRYIRLK